MKIEVSLSELLAWAKMGKENFGLDMTRILEFVDGEMKSAVASEPQATHTNRPTPPFGRKTANFVYRNGAIVRHADLMIEILRERTSRSMLLSEMRDLMAKRHQAHRTSIGARMAELCNQGIITRRKIGSRANGDWELTLAQDPPKDFTISHKAKMADA